MASHFLEEMERAYGLSPGGALPPPCPIREPGAAQRGLGRGRGTRSKSLFRGRKYRTEGQPRTEHHECNGGQAWVPQCGI